MACFITAFCVWPTVMWFVKRQPLPLRHTLLWGLAFGNLPVLLVAVLVGSSGKGTPTPLRPLLLASLLGLAGAAAFWAISIRGRDLSREPRRAQQ